MGDSNTTKNRAAASFDPDRARQMKTRTVEVAGAGLAGLAAAARLAQLGWRVRLHERNHELRMFGAGIWTWESGLKTLETLGAFDAAVANARVIKEWQIRDAKDRLIMSRLTSDTDRMLLPRRADMYQALIDRALHYGVEILTSSVGVAVRPEGVLVTEDGNEHRADLIVVADGAYSRLRESILATAWMDFGIEVGIRMLIDHQEGDLTDRVIEWWNGPWRLLYNPCTDGQNYIFLSAPISDERGRRVPIDRQRWIDKFPHVELLIHRFQEASRWDRIVMVKCRKWTEGRVAIIGDAAHAMPPNLGQAANTAFINVMALAKMVTESDDIPGTLRDWEVQQRPITSNVQWWSYLYGFVLGKWPTSLQPLRSDFVRALAKTEWFDEGLNRGARHVPAGYARSPSAMVPSD
jgi:2-polyprenyl-6-methoxyphenol hydroxylase-like FAD-dependent oxidoreductase